MLELGLKILASYLLGSLNGALIMGGLAGVDIRRLGSGNAGGTNALRTMGKAFAARVMLIDVLKGVLPPLLLPALALPGVHPDPDVGRQWLAVACAAAAIVGHCYPVFFRFAGGKGAATAMGAIAALNPLLLIPAAIVWFAVLGTSGYVGLATMLAAAVLPVWVLFMGPDVPLLAFTVALAAFIVFTHRGNLQRLLAGSEHRLDRAMVFRRRQSHP